MRGSFDRSSRLIKCSFRSIEHESNSDRTIQKLQDFFFTILIDRAKVSTDRKCLTANFHLESSKTWIFTLTTLRNNIFKLKHHHYYNLSLYMLIYTTPFTIYVNHIMTSNPSSLGLIIGLTVSRYLSYSWILICLCFLCLYIWNPYATLKSLIGWSLYHTNISCKTKSLANELTTAVNYSLLST